MAARTETPKPKPGSINKKRQRYCGPDSLDARPANARSRSPERSPVGSLYPLPIVSHAQLMQRLDEFDRRILPRCTHLVGARQYIRETYQEKCGDKVIDEYDFYPRPPKRSESVLVTSRVKTRSHSGKCNKVLMLCVRYLTAVEAIVRAKFEKHGAITKVDKMHIRLFQCIWPQFCAPVNQFGGSMSAIQHGDADLSTVVYALMRRKEKALVEQNYGGAWPEYWCDLVEHRRRRRHFQSFCGRNARQPLHVVYDIDAQLAYDDGRARSKQLKPAQEASGGGARPFAAPAVRLSQSAPVATASRPPVWHTKRDHDDDDHDDASYSDGDNDDGNYTEAGPMTMVDAATSRHALKAGNHDDADNDEAAAASTLDRLQFKSVAPTARVADMLDLW